MNGPILAKCLSCAGALHSSNHTAYLSSGSVINVTDTYDRRLLNASPSGPPIMLWSQKAKYCTKAGVDYPTSLSSWYVAGWTVSLKCLLLRLVTLTLVNNLNNNSQMRSKHCLSGKGGVLKGLHAKHTLREDSYPTLLPISAHVQNLHRSENTTVSCQSPTEVVLGTVPSLKLGHVISKGYHRYGCRQISVDSSRNLCVCVNVCTLGPSSSSSSSSWAALLVLTSTSSRRFTTRMSTR